MSGARLFEPHFVVVSESEWLQWNHATTADPCPHCHATQWEREYSGDPVTRVGSVSVWCGNCKCTFPFRGMARMHVPDGVPMRTEDEPSRVPTDVLVVVSEGQWPEILRDRQIKEQRIAELGLTQCAYCGSSEWAVESRPKLSKKTGPLNVWCNQCIRSPAGVGI